MRFRRLLAGLLSASFLAVPTAASAAPAETYPTQVSMSPSKTRMAYGTSFTLSGQLATTINGGATYYFVEDAPVTLERRFPGKSWSVIANTTTSSVDGTYRFTTSAKQNASYRVRYAGESREYGDASTPRPVTFQPSVSPERAVKVTRTFALSSFKRSGATYFRGKVAPTYRGKVVEVQRRTCQKCAWKVFKKVRTTRTSVFAVRVSYPRRGEWHYRARTAASPAFLLSTSSRYLAVYRY